MNFEDKVGFVHFVGNFTITGTIDIARESIKLKIDNCQTPDVTFVFSKIDQLIDLRDTLSAVIAKFAEVTKTGFK